MNISIIHPSRNRPYMSFETAKKWIESAKKEVEIEYYLSIDTDEPQKELYKQLFSNLPVKIAEFENQTAIQAINNSAKLTKNELIIVVSDDFDCFNHWDEWLLSYLKDKKDFIVKTDDGIQPRLITLPILDRVYYERFGYVYYPEYQHMFCDTEMTEVGHILGKVIDLRNGNFKFQHKHYTAGLMQKDAINEKNDATWNQGEMLFNNRKMQNFFIK